MTPASVVQRNPYQGSPPRPWMVLRLVAGNGELREFKLLADTGCPFAFIIGRSNLSPMNRGEGRFVNTNFGILEGAWFKFAMPELGLSELIYVRL